MELKIKTPTFPEVIEFNFEELKTEITKKASDYVSLVYTDDQIKDAKKDIAALRKFTKALSDERIRIKNECLKPYEEFEAKIKELDGIVQKAITNIDSQIKAADEKKKQEKLDAISEYFESCEKPFEVKLETIMDQKWLNASVSMKSVKAAIDSIIESFREGLSALQNLPEFSFEAIEVYKTTLDLNKAINEGHRLSEMQKRKAEYEAEQARKKAAAEANKQKEEFARHRNPPETEPVKDKPAEQERQWIGFRALLTVQDALALKSFFESRNIKFESI